jgi:HAD superfamily hydrolase (TIGR01509 family)
MQKTLEIEGKVLLFDFDGTLVETEALAREVVRDFFEERGFPDGPEFARMIIGRTWKLAVDMMSEAARARGVDLGDRGILLSEFRSRYRKRCAGGVSMIPGFLEILPVVRKKARFLGIVTGSERDEVEEILDSHGLRSHFDQIWGCGDYSESKPHPAPYLAALTEHRFDPAEVLVFEDSSAGMESARRAGLRWVQIAHESHAGEPDPGALLVIRDWRELSIR